VGIFQLLLAEFLAAVRLWPEQRSPFMLPRSLGGHHAQQRSPIKSFRPPSPPDIWLDRRGGRDSCAGSRIVVFPEGPRDKRTPETPQNTTLQRPVWPKHSHLCRVALPFSPSISRLNPRAHHNPCRARRAPQSDPRVKLRLQARRCLLSSTALMPKRPRAG
jgi:hypothetical protein